MNGTSSTLRTPRDQPLGRQVRPTLSAAVSRTAEFRGHAWLDQRSAAADHLPLVDLSHHGISRRRHLGPTPRSQRDACMGTVQRLQRDCRCLHGLTDTTGIVQLEREPREHISHRTRSVVWPDPSRVHAGIATHRRQLCSLLHATNNAPSAAS